MSSSGNKQPS